MLIDRTFSVGSVIIACHTTVPRNFQQQRRAIFNDEPSELIVQLFFLI